MKPRHYLRNRTVAWVIILCMAVGWGANLVKLASSDFTMFIDMILLRTAGVILPPVGIIMGFI